MGNEVGEAIVVNLALWFRVLLVGGILILFPRITRKGLLFGVYVGEEFADGQGARELIRAWDRGCKVVMVSALLLGLTGTLVGHAIAGAMTGTIVLLLGGAGLYFRSYARVRELARPNLAPQISRATAALGAAESRAGTVGAITLGVCLVAALSTIAFALMNYPAMGTPLPSLWSLIGGAEGWSEKNYVYVMYVPSWNLVLSPFLALLAVIITGAKRSLRESPVGRSAEAQDAFRALSANVFSGLAVFICAILTVFSVQVVRIGLSRTDSLGVGIWVIAVLMIVFSVASLLLMLRRYGQGGALLEEASLGGALTGGLAENDRWVWGVVYLNREDPSWLVESRFGLGYSTNWGNPKAALFTIITLVLVLSLVVLGFFL